MHGVYAIRASINNSEIEITGVANIGTRPTFAGTSVILEAHLFNFSENIYEKTLKVTLCSLLREEQKFSGADQLKSQIANDCRDAYQILHEGKVK